VTVDTQRLLAGVDLLAIVSADVVLKKRGRNEWHGACPFERDGTDRFWVNTDYQTWHCRGCGIEGGDAIGYIMRLHGLDFLQACVFLGGEPTTERRAPLKPIGHDRQPAERPEDLDIEPLGSHPVALKYVTVTRGIPREVAEQAGVGWIVRPNRMLYATFPLGNLDGAAVAYQMRAVDDSFGHRHDAVGPKRHGLFFTTRILEPEPVIGITEAPLDALSLHAAGVPSVAICGSGDGPAWLDQIVQGHNVLLATDADTDASKGDALATRLLSRLAGKVVASRARPPLKDWNAALQARGVDAIHELVLPKHDINTCAACVGQMFGGPRCYLGNPTPEMRDGHPSAFPRLDLRKERSKARARKESGHEV
jgi:hypothetical protein